MGTDLTHAPHRPSANDPWRLVEGGQFEQAIEEYTKWIAQGRQGYANRGIAYLHLGRMDLARADFVAGEKNSSLRSDHFFQWIAAVDWLSGKAKQAQAIWLETVCRIREGKISYTDAAGGVSSGLLLWFASVVLGEAEVGNEAIEFLERRLAKRNGGRWSDTAWPAPIARFIVNEETPETLLAAVDSTPILQERQLCVAHFYIGVRALSRGNCSGAAAAWQAAAAQQRLIEIEYYLASHQLANL